MKTLIKPAYYKILKLFYENRNSPLHLRDIARQVKLNESSVTRHLNCLVKEGVLTAKKDANLRKFFVFYSHVPEIFEMFDEEKLFKLPLLRKNALIEYVKSLDKKPVFLLVFGSTAKGTYRNDSDIDILEVYNEKTDTKKAIEMAGALTGMNIQSFQMTLGEFLQERKLKKDYVVQSAISTGFCIFNAKYYYEVISYE